MSGHCFFLALVCIRIAGLRALGKKSNFDQVTSLMTGALLAKAIVKEESFNGILAAAVILMACTELLHGSVLKIKRQSIFSKESRLSL